MAALAYFGGTLTLPGIAGIILTIGMAVDSNVLVFERIREELRANKGPMQAMKQGFDRAFVDLSPLAAQVHFGGPLDDTLGDEAAGHGTNLGNLEDLPNHGAAQVTYSGAERALEP